MPPANPPLINSATPYPKKIHTINRIYTWQKLYRRKKINKKSDRSRVEVRPKVVDKGRWLKIIRRHYLEKLKKKSRIRKKDKHKSILEKKKIPATFHFLYFLFHAGN